MKRLMLIGAVLLSSAAIADHERSYEYAKVLSAEPITRTVTRSSPREVCEDVPVEIHRERSSRGGKLIGALIGGAIGHAVGHRHDHPTAGTVVGAIAGAHVGAAASDSRTVVERRTELRCRSTYDTWQEIIVDGYDVRYKYQGKVYHTVSPYDPGKRIRIRVSVQPEWDD